MPTLLLVDDDSAMLEMVGDSLRAIGYEVVSAENATAALALFDLHPIDAVIADVQMPRMDGIHLCQELLARAQAAGRTLPVWLMTGARTVTVERQAAEAGAVAVLSKPFSIVALEGRLKARLGREAPR